MVDGHGERHHWHEGGLELGCFQMTDCAALRGHEGSTRDPRRAMLIDKNMGTNGQNRRINRTLWGVLRAAYIERATIGHVQRKGNVGYKMARKAIKEGWPEFGFPPFEELDKAESSGGNGNTTTLDPASETTDLSAASGLAMSTAVTVARVTEQYARQILEKLEADGIVVEGDLSPKIILDLTKSVNVCNELLGRALKLQEMQDSQPKTSTSRAIIELLDRCSDDELEEVIETGHPPDRLIHQGPPTTQRLLAMLNSGEPEPEADTADLEEGAVAEGLF